MTNKEQKISFFLGDTV